MRLLAGTVEGISSRRRRRSRKKDLCATAGVPMAPWRKLTTSNTSRTTAS
jgi:hypothetical protein